MLGAIAGDIIGSVYEAAPIKTTDFPLFGSGATFTDDTVLTVAVAAAILDAPSGAADYGRFLQTYARRYPRAGYGGSFFRWFVSAHPEPYNSWGNGSAMRVSPVGVAFHSADRVLAEAERSAAVTHDHPEGIKGAQSTALAIHLARTGTDREGIRREIADRFGYDLDRTVEDIRPGYRFDISCQGSVPEAMIAFFDSADFEDAVRLAVSLGGDSDTQGCIAGGIAQAFYGGVPESIAEAARARLPEDLLSIVDRFEARYGR